MKVNFTKEWCERMAKLEGDRSIGAGAAAATVSKPCDELRGVCEQYPCCPCGRAARNPMTPNDAVTRGPSGTSRGVQG